MQNKEYRRVYAKINLDAIKNNILEVRKKVGDDIKIMAVIKADGYGHGAIPIAFALNEIGVDQYAVATEEEGVQLRRAYIPNPILILGYTHTNQYENIICSNLSMTVYSYEMAKNISKCAVEIGRTASIHIKLETGMNRIGFALNDKSLEEIKLISKLPNIKMDGIFSHMARADEKDKTSAYEQISRFNDFVLKLEKEDVYFPLRHMLNSAGIAQMSLSRCNMVRAGIITYGLYPSSDVTKESISITPAMELKSYIVHLKDVEAGEGIGYNHTYITPSRRKIATIPVGYADGYKRALSGKARVLIRGQYAPIVGRICMDQMMVDVTDIEGVSMLDEVTLIGKDGENAITVEELGALSDSFNYEFCCTITKRVPRVFVKDGEEMGYINYLEI